MSDDIAFKIQLGIILPKLHDQVANHLTSITEELVEIVKAGTLGDGEISLDEIKQVLMRDLEIFLDDAIFPEIENKLRPLETAPEESDEELQPAEAEHEAA